MPHEVGVVPAVRMDVEQRRGHRCECPKQCDGNCSERDGHQLKAERCLHSVDQHQIGTKVVAQRRRSGAARPRRPICKQNGIAQPPALAWLGFSLNCFLELSREVFSVIRVILGKPANSFWKNMLHANILI